jgi:uncharacterized protein DUF262
LDRGGQLSELDFTEDDTEAADEQSEPLRIAPAERKLVTQPYDYSVETLAQRVATGKLILDIDYQRKYVWDNSKASRLIESLLMNVPVPVCYFAEIDNARHEVIDGLQRITAIVRFLGDEFSLRGISVLEELSGKTFSELPTKAQRQLENRAIRCIVITEESHPDIKFDVFERLNTGSVRLSAQELRNCIYRGKLNDSLKEIAKDSRLKQIMAGSRNHRMGHEELALRFFALHDAIDAYRPPLRQLLNEYMRKNRTNGVPRSLQSSFFEVCEAVYGVFGATPFQVTDQDGKVRNPVNKALFDAIMISAAFADLNAYKSNADAVKELRETLLGDEEFQAAIGRATADRSRMHKRVGDFAEGLREIGIPVDLDVPGGRDAG